MRSLSSLFRQSRNRDDKILFYPTEELPQENYPPPLSRSPSLSAKAHRDDKASQHRNFILNRQRSSEICHLPFPICNYNSDIPTVRYILYMRYISQAKCIYNRQRSSEICHLPFPICNYNSDIPTVRYADARYIQWMRYILLTQNAIKIGVSPEILHFAFCILHLKRTLSTDKVLFVMPVLQYRG